MTSPSAGFDSNKYRLVACAGGSSVARSTVVAASAAEKQVSPERSLGRNRNASTIPVCIGSRATNREVIGGENPTCAANAVAKTNWYTLMASGARFTVSVSSPSCWNPTALHRGRR
jgi:hypothetical protein